MGVRLKNARPHGSLGLPAAGGDAFELAPGEVREIDEAHAAVLLKAPGVPEFVECGWLVAGGMPAPAALVTPAEEASPAAEPSPEPEAAPSATGRRRRGG